MKTSKADVCSIDNSGQPRRISPSNFNIFSNYARPARIAAFAVAMLLALTMQAFASDDITVLHVFTGGNDGSYPDGNVVADAAGNLYGTTQIGGLYGAGTVFKLTPASDGTWQFSVLYAFTGGADGGNPLASLIFDAAGNAYSTAASGGANGLGVVFELIPPAQPDQGKEWTEKVLYSFQGGSDGAVPLGNVIFDAAGNLYGTTTTGGMTHIGCPPAKGCGTIFELAPTHSGPWKERIIHRFRDAFTEGATPRSGLVFDASGNLYGTTYQGGNNDVCGGSGCGTVFELTPGAGESWKLQDLIDFNAIDGALPMGGVTLSSDGSVIGSTSFGGTENAGTIFVLKQESGVWKFSTIYNFDTFDGLQPAGNLAVDKDGNIYGATYEGGVNDWGTIFRLARTTGMNEWTENLLYNFVVSGTHFGANPLGGVMLDAAGNLYLTANQGGNLDYCQPNSGCGTVIKFAHQ
jgi:uncharacterized repeat protein (TIGR03803 family)